MGPRLAVPNEAQNRRQGLQAGRTPGPGGGSGGGAGENPTQQTPKTDNPCRTPGPMPGQLGCIFSPTEPPEVGPTRRPSDSLPQALRPPWRYLPLFSGKASFVLLLASLHNPSLFFALQTQVLRCFRGTDCDQGGAGTGRHLSSGLALQTTLFPLSPWLSHRPRHSGKPPPPSQVVGMQAC